jgi:NAD(P)H-nitrite reductase large subunit
MRYVIIGGSIAGISAAKAIREQDLSADIRIISGEKTGPYYRPLIPAILSGKKSESDMLYPEDPLQGKNITSMLGTAIRVDAKRKEVLLASGERLSFDALLLATGGVPLKPSLPGLEGPGVYPLRNMAQAIQISEAASSAGSAVVIGGGLVGIKAALALRERNQTAGKSPGEVFVIETLPEILSGRLDRRAAQIVRAAVEREGVTVLTNTSVSKIVREQSAVTGVKLGSGRMLKADLVVVAAGVKPNISYLKHSGIHTNRGVLANASLRTNVAGIYAAGDVVEGRELLSNKSAVSGLWSNAVEMGRAAGANMAGGNVKYPGFLTVMNASEIAGIPFVSAGLIDAEGKKYKTISRENGKSYWKLVLDGDFLVGAVFVGDLKNAGIYTNLIKNQVPITRFRDRIERRTASYPDLLIASQRVAGQ